MCSTLFYVFILKLCDCSLSVMKTVFLMKNKFLVSSCLYSLSAALFVFVADTMANSPVELKGWIAFVIFFANFVGSYFPPRIIKRLEKDRLFVFMVTSPTFDEGVQLADRLRAYGLPVSTSIAYGDDVEKTLLIKAYAESRQDSKMISSCLDERFKWHIVEAV